MRITKRQLRRIIRESILREQAEDRITVDAFFKWDDYEYSGEPGESQERVTISKGDLDEWGDDYWSGALASWAGMNLDGGMDVSDVELVAGDQTRLQNWIDAHWGGSGDGGAAAAGDVASGSGEYNYPRMGKTLPEAIEQFLATYERVGKKLPMGGSPAGIAKKLKSYGWPDTDSGETLVDAVTRLMK